MLPKNVHKVENIPTNATANAGSTSAEEFSDFSLEIAAISDIGNSREINQDSYATIHQAEQPMRALLVVADGMGGYEHGEVASKIAVETVVHDYELGSFLNHREAKPDETFSLIDQMIANNYFSWKTCVIG